MKLRRMIAAAAAIALLIVAAALLVKPGRYLVIRDGETGALLARYPVEDGSEFAIGVVHSVNLRPLVTLFEVQGRTMCARETYYYAFGAGVQTELEEGETMTFGEDGTIIVGNISKTFDKIEYSVGVWQYDRTLMLGDIRPVYDQVKDRIGVFTEETEVQIGQVRVISLSALCGRGKLVAFACEDMILPF